MRFALTDDQQAFAEATRELLARECPPEVVRAAWPAQSADGRPGQGAGAGARAEPRRLGRLWQALAATGALGTLVDEARGGLGLDEVAMAVVCEETGYAAVPFGVVETMVVVAPLLAAAGDQDARLGTILEGGTPIAVATGGGAVAGRSDGAPGPVAAWVEPRVTTELLVLPAPGGDGAATPAGVLLGGIDVERTRSIPSVDGARRLAELHFDGTPTTVPGADAALARCRGILGTAAQLVGLGRRVLDMTVAYVGERHQFGVAVGSFQAVKHHLADVRLQLEFTRPMVLGAAWALATGQPQAGREVAAAKAMASDTALLAARAALQCHGAIGHTVEYDLHLYVKRAWALAAAWGDAAQHGNAVADALSL